MKDINVDIVYGLPRQLVRRVADELLERFSLTEAADKVVKDFSGGMRRRLDLAASVIVAPDLLFLDEPTTGFDPAARRQAWDVIDGLRNFGKTVLLTTHYMDEAEHLADRVGIVVQGRLVALGSPAELGDGHAVEL